MLGFFTQYLGQKSGQFISVQALQTLNILFENISNETFTCKFSLSCRLLGTLIGYSDTLSDFFSFHINKYEEITKLLHRLTL